MVLLVVIAGCQTGKVNLPETENLPATEQTMPLPDVALTKELLEQLLSAEIAVRQGQYEQAVDQLFIAAKESNDPRLAAKTAYWSLQSGLFDKARLAAQLWLDILNGQPENSLSDARIVLAISLLELKKHDQALAVLTQVIKNSADRDVYKRIAGEMSRLKNTENVVNLYQKLLEQSDDPENANLGLAILSTRLNDIELSKTSIDKVLQVNAGNEDAALIKLSYLFEDQKEEEINAFSKRFLKNQPQAHKFRMEFARYLSANAEPEKAIKQFKVIAENDEQQFMEATLNIIALAMQEDDYKLADKNLLAALDADPTNNRLVYYRCQVQREMENHQAARDLCNEISLGEFYFPAQLELATILADDDQLEQALKHLDTVPVSGTDEQIQIYLRKQQLLYQADQIERSAVVLNKSLIQYPDNTSLLYARGLVLSELGKVNEHERDMRKLIELDPENAHAYNALGYTLTDLTTRYEEALVLIKKAVELNPDDAYILDSLGWVYFKLNNLDQAKVHLEQAFDLSGDAEIAAHLGELYWTLGDRDKARSIWRKARKNTPDNKVLIKTLERFL